MTIRELRRRLPVLLLLCAAVAPLVAHANGSVAKEVSLIVNGKRLVASNIRTSQFDELDLNAQERIAQQAESKGVIIVITNQRLIAYGVGSGWKTRKTEAGESVISITAEDLAAFVTTNRRYLNFNGETGIWGIRERRTSR